jgi:hypothetical protein
MEKDEIHQTRNRGGTYKGTGRDPGELFPGRHFRHQSDDEFLTILDRREIRPRLIRLAQRLR